MEYLQYDSLIFNIPIEVKTRDTITSQHMILPSTIDKSDYSDVTNAGIWTRCIGIDSVDYITITGRLSIDGNFQNQNFKNEHMHCLFFYDCHSIKIESVNAFSGGGDSELTNCYSSDIKINYIKATTSGRENLVLEHVTNCDIGVALCDNSLGNTKCS